MPSLRRFWSVLAILAGVALIAFELRRAGGVTGENALWVFLGALVVFMAGLNLFPPDPPPRDFRDNDLPPLG
jgi:hypothetical protein